MENINALNASKVKTYAHKIEVLKNMNIVINQLIKRAEIHDNSKLELQELNGFANWDYKLSSMEYDSKEYKEALKEMKEICLDHHYAVNTHHPEHFNNGINDMDLIDIMEMLCDWLAAMKRSKYGTLKENMVKNKNKFNIDDQLYNILMNTINVLEGGNK
jgi:hypothetical protein